MPYSGRYVEKPKKEEATMIKIVTVFALFVGIAAAQFPPKPEAPKKAPVISTEKKAAFFKALAQNQTAQTALEQLPQAKVAQEKQKAFQDQINELVNLCGKDFQLQLIKDGKPDNDGDPTCVAKPAEPVKATEPAKK
jgi:hypothetical protein